MRAVLLRDGQVLLVNSNWTSCLPLLVARSVDLDVDSLDRLVRATRNGRR